MKRLICFLLMLCIFSSLCFLGCESNSNDGGENETSEDGSVNDSSESSDESVEPEKDKPADGFLNYIENWENETVTILGHNGEYWYHSIQIDTAEKTGDSVNDAFYERNALIKEQYGIDIEVVLPEDDEWHINMIREDISSSIYKYDAYCIPIVYVAPLAVEGLLQDFNSVQNDYLHLDQVWWDQTVMEDAAIDNRVYFLAGDAIVDDDESTWAVYFNKDLLKEYNIQEDPYQLVREGKWTIDKMYELAQKADKTVDTEKSYYSSLQVGGDQWGIVAHCYDAYLFMLGCEQTMIDNSSEQPVYRVLEQENVDTFNSIIEFFYDSKNCGVYDYNVGWNASVNNYDTKQIFAIGNALFMPGNIANVGRTIMREAEINYGILPMPKRNELQEKYSSAATVYHCSVLSMPVTCKNPDVTCYAFEAMAFYGNKLVTPKYYERILTNRRFEDQDSKDMLDLIFRNRTYDLVDVYRFDPEGMGASYLYGNVVGMKSTEIVSCFERNKHDYQAGLELFIAQAYN